MKAKSNGLIEKQEPKYMLYCHKNKLNGKMYFGITKNDISTRYHASHGYKGCPVFYNAIRKYGWDNFEHIVVKENMTREFAEIAEKYAIAYFQTNQPGKGYNIQSGGKSTGEMSEDGYRRLVEAASGKNSKKAKSVVVFDLYGNKIEEFITIKDASLKYNSTIIQKNSDRYSRAINGFFFRYKSIVGDADKMDEDDLANSPTERPKSDVLCHANPIAVFDSETGMYLKAIPCLRDVHKEYGVHVGKFYKKKYLVTDKHIFRYANDVVGINFLDLSFLDAPVVSSQKSVNQYDRVGNLVNTFPSLKEASLKTGISYKSMSQCASHKIQSSGGYVWRYTNDSVQFEKPKSCSETRKVQKKYNYKPVDQIDLVSGEVINTFESMAEAAKAVNVSKSSIYSVAHHVGNCVSAAGYGWRYHDSA